MRIPIKDIKTVAKETKTSYSAANKKMMAARRKYGISYSLYTKLELYKLSEAEFEKRAQAICDRRKKMEVLMQIKELSYDKAGKYAEYLRKQYKISLDEYIDNELYKLNEYELAIYADKKEKAMLQPEEQNG